VEEIVGSAFIISLLAATIRLATPIIFAALGELITERAGILNLGVEGIMLMGAFVGFWGAYQMGNLWLGVLLGVLVGALMGLLMAFMSVTLRVDQVISGMGIYFLGLGLSSFLYRVTFGVRAVPPTIEGFKDVPIPLLSRVPFLGPILFRQNILVYLALVLVPLSVVALYRTTWGLMIRATGENPRAADTLGVNVFFIRYLCVVLGGILVGLGGVVLSTAHLKMFWENMTVGRGFIAVAIVYFGKWHPYRTLFGALLFGGAYALQLWLQAMGAPVPHQLLLMFPYILTIAVLAVVAREARGPAALGIPYRRGEV